METGPLIGSGVPTAPAQGSAVQPPAQPPPLPAPPLSTPAVVLREFSRQQFSIKLETHIDEYYKGRGNFSRGVSSKLRSMNFANIDSLDPKSRRAYIGYATALGYGQRARMINSVNSLTDSLNRIA